MCAEIKRYGFNLRLSLNLTDIYNNLEPLAIFDRCKALGANQITFRLLYNVESSVSPEIHDWINEHRCSTDIATRINWHITNYGRKMERLPFGAIRYSVDGMSCVLDTDCMSTDSEKDAIRYLILRPNCKLYTLWDDAGSILF